MSAALCMDTILYALQVDKLYFHGLSPLYHNLKRKSQFLKFYCIIINKQKYLSCTFSIYKKLSVFFI